MVAITATVNCPMMPKDPSNQIAPSADLLGLNLNQRRNQPRRRKGFPQMRKVMRYKITALIFEIKNAVD